MNKHFRLGSKEGTSVNIRIHPRTDFREILKTLNALFFPRYIKNQEDIKYAVLELISNSQRAHREKEVEEEIVASFQIAKENLEVSVRDCGRGFDPGILPYQLDENFRDIDPLSEAFQKYQERYHYSRFGMGLLVVKKVFPRFELGFIDFNEKTIPWRAGKVMGTLIQLARSITMSDEHRSLRRVHTYAKAFLVEEKMPGYVRNLSRSGCQIALLKRIPLKRGDNLMVQVIPGDEIGIPPFMIALQVAWIQPDPFYYLIGGKTTTPSAEENRNRTSLNELCEYWFH